MIPTATLGDLTPIPVPPNLPLAPLTPAECALNVFVQGIPMAKVLIAAPNPAPLPTGLVHPLPPVFPPAHPAVGNPNIAVEFPTGMAHGIGQARASGHLTTHKSQPVDPLGIASVFVYIGL